MADRVNFDKMEILLVDDRQENLLTLEAVLSSPDYRLIKASSGDEALKYLLDHSPALILMDVQMPDLSGFETASIIKGSERTREIPIVFVTGINKDERFVHEGYDHGAVDYIYKPYDPHILKSKVAVLAGIRRNQERMSRLVAVQLATTQALADTSNVKDVISNVLKSVCSSLGWDLGNFWKLDKQAEVLFCESCWQDPGCDAPEFVAESLRMLVPVGVGLPGRVWAGGKTLWISDLEEEGNFPRRAAAAKDLGTAVGVPVAIQGEVLGVLEVLSRKKQKEDHDLIQILGAIGSQIGQFLKRTEAIELARATEARTRLLAEASATLSSSLNYEETLQALATLLVKSLASWCAIDVIDENGQPRSVAVAHPDPGKLALAREMHEKYPPDWKGLTGAPNVIRNGKSELYHEVPDELLVKSARDQAHLKIIRDLAIKSAMVVPLTVRGNTLGAITLIATDSERRYTEDDLSVAEELARRAAMAIDNARLYREAQNAIHARDEFFSIASHELKTPITSLKMILQLTERGVDTKNGISPSPEKLEKMLGTSNRQVDRLTHLVEDLLDVTRIGAGKLGINPAELNLSQLVEEVVDRFCDAFAAAHCPVELNLEPKVIGFWDSSRIEQVMVNLLSNAVKYAPGKPIKIEVSNGGETAKIIIQDFGPGIPPEKQSKIFERFERATSSRNVSGLGLGLFIVKQVVEAHHGTIGVESQEGNGSTFTIELPLNSSAGLRQERNVSEIVSATK